MGERMSKEEMTGSSVHGHQTRYRLAAGHLLWGDRVLDAACGTGYGSEILLSRGGVLYYGVDYKLKELIVDENPNRTFIESDLQKFTPTFDYEVFVGFETIEHLEDYSHYLNVAKMARRTMLFSVPVIPTVGINPWHLHDFEPGELVSIIEDDRWQCIQTLDQPSEFSEIYIFARK